ncbi:MAG: aa3-type cytochrome c oxidase subunit IV [Alphaproteobacteria bacterium HGW-Alphaproteobacteria-4]|jgi:hypothetical protein|nr:MAG: aa3-type cytochrome c oxidase subunit IV [Alphaproteobacteria bacterium HGW-Alphaproteobacteria-4]
MGEQTAGGMNIAAQERTFAGFITFSKRAAIAIAVFLVFLALVNG